MIDDTPQPPTLPAALLDAVPTALRDSASPTESSVAAPAAPARLLTHLPPGEGWERQMAPRPSLPAEMLESATLDAQVLNGRVFSGHGAPPSLPNDLLDSSVEEPIVPPPPGDTPPSPDMPMFEDTWDQLARSLAQDGWLDPSGPPDEDPQEE